MTSPTPCRTRRGTLENTSVMSSPLRVQLHLVAGLMAAVLLTHSGCNQAPGDAAVANRPGADSAPGIIALTAEESVRIGLVVQPATRSDFRTSRDFPAILQPNERAMADITTLVRGRVVDVYADLGQQVEANALLAILYSSDLGLAQSAYLKS